MSTVGRRTLIIHPTTFNTQLSIMSAKYNFTGKVALVTGSSSGIGAAIALQFAQYGAQVAITGRDATNLAKVADEIKEKSGQAALQVVGDLLDHSFPKKLVDTTVAKFRRLDILVNNAGSANQDESFDSEKLLKAFDDVITLNVRSVLELTQLAAPELEKTKGNIINISSNLSVVPYRLVYSTSKAALDMLTKVSAKELGPKGIRVNSINPGPVVTEFYRSVGGTKEIFDQFMQEFAQKNALRRVGQSVEIAHLASFLASDDAVNMTGSIVVNDSGFLVRDV